MDSLCSTNKIFDLTRYVDLHDDSKQPGCFYIPPGVANPLVYNGKVVGDILEGNSVNCETITLCPHGSCTHTECIGHITPEKSVVIPPPPIMNAYLITIQPEYGELSKEYYPSYSPEDL